MKPTAISGRAGMIETSINATIGKAMICMIAPTRKSRGRCTRRAKSGSVRVRPMENMMIASEMGRNVRAISSVLMNNFLPHWRGGQSEWPSNFAEGYAHQDVNHTPRRTHRT